MCDVPMQIISSCDWHINVHDGIHSYCEPIIITTVCHFSIPLSGHAPGLPTEYKHTLRITLFRVPTPTGVVFLIGEDAEGPDPSK